MADISKTEVKRDRDVFYYRKRLKNRIFAKLANFFAEEAKRTGITQQEIARRLKKDPAQISRWLSGPSNLTLDTISDILLAMDAEADPPPIVRFKDRATANFMHPLIVRIVGARDFRQEKAPSKAVLMPDAPGITPTVTTTSGTTNQVATQKLLMI